MAYAERSFGVNEPANVVAVGDYHDRVRWGPIFGGLVVAISTQLVLSALGAAIGLTNLSGSGAPRSNAGDVGSAVGIWSIISLFIALFVGGWVAARACGPTNRNTALLNGAILWATTLAISGWLLASGVSGAFGILASNAGEILNQTGTNPNIDPNVTAQQARNIAGDAARVGWSFVFGSLLALVASMVGASIGTRRPRVNGTTVRTAE
ncbi:MAG: hypothetical protein KME17_11980 [Cyanosarcina radialis HA8281-LM2]|jgi:hypothetical protein|nr:hypothetical protein [Cyanosarcina radialis HA8281-LM2]